MKLTYGSTICYASSTFLQDELKYLFLQDKILWYAYIRHDAELENLKEHVHLLVAYDQHHFTKWDLQERLTEPQKGCMPIRHIKEKSLSDWLLYAIHEPRYLELKGIVRLKHYQATDVKTNRPEMIEALYQTAMEDLYSAPSAYDRYMAYAEAGLSTQEVMRRVGASPQTARSIKDFYADVKQDLSARLEAEAQKVLLKENQERIKEKLKK